MPKRVMLLTGDSGFGHRGAVVAVEAALKNLYGDKVETAIFNPLQDPSIPELVRYLETGYDDYVIDDSRLYQLTWVATDTPVVAQLIQDVTTTILNKVLTKQISEYKPDIIVTSYPPFTQAAIRVTHELKRDVPFDVVVTDLVDIHSLWFHKEASLTFVPTGSAYRQALDLGIDKSQIQLTGMPVHPRFPDEKRTKAKLRKALGWDKDMVTMLIVGSARTRETASIALLLDRSGLNLQIAVAAGNSTETLAQLDGVEWKNPVHVYGMARNIPEMMLAADMVACKAGGLIVTESLACGQPLLIYEALPGQEVGNVKYVTDCGAGAWSPGPIGVLTNAFAWLSGDQAELKKRKAAAKQAGKPRAAYDIAERVFNQI
jgi:UDP-N-acetylglucosamine:LPS N-acetylglucosamine transferase